MEKKKLNLKEFKASALEVEKLLEIKGGSGSCYTGSANCHTNVGGNDGDTRRCDSFLCN